MELLKMTMSQMIDFTLEEFEKFSQQCNRVNYPKNSLLSSQGIIPDDIFFIEKGIVRVLITDSKGVEHTIHFALENQFIADYSNFIQGQPAVYDLQALENCSIIVIPRKAVEWGYKHMGNGNKLGRLIAEYYFIYQDARINNAYIRTPKERYDLITDVFPGIHQRVPQHMIASYLGITPIHLSRLKNNKL